MKINIKKLNIWKVLIFIIIFLFIVFFAIHKTITPIFFSLAEIEVNSIINKAINQAVAKEVDNINYQDIIEYVYNDQGDIVMIQPNTKYINNFTTNVSLSVQKNLQKLSRETVTIPLTRILGIDILAGYGPDMNIKIVPAGYALPPKLEDSFSSVGINQTRHKIYLNVAAKVKLIVPFNSKIIDVYADVPVTEVVILGRVPQIYVGMNQEGLSGIFGELLSN